MNFFIDNKYIFRSFIFLCILWMASFYLVFFVFLLLFIGVFWIFRVRKFDHRLAENLEKMNIMSPITGKLQNFWTDDEKSSWELKNRFLDTYGVYGPCQSLEVIDCEMQERSGIFTLKSYHNILKVKSLEGIEFTIILQSRFSFIRPAVYVQSGDIVLFGGLLGYLPFGGKVVIEVPLRCDLSVKVGDKLRAFYILLGQMKG